VPTRFLSNLHRPTFTKPKDLPPLQGKVHIPCHVDTLLLSCIENIIRCAYAEETKRVRFQTSNGNQRGAHHNNSSSFEVNMARYKDEDGETIQKILKILRKKPIPFLNSELSCSICSEVFVKPVRLQCLHTFCQTCILQHLRNQRDCPLCGVKYKSTYRLDTLLLRCIENLIESAYTQTEKNKRDKLVASRENLEKKLLLLVIDRPYANNEKAITQTGNTKRDKLVASRQDLEKTQLPLVADRPCPFLTRWFQWFPDEGAIDLTWSQSLLCLVLLCLCLLLIIL